VISILLVRVVQDSAADSQNEKVSLCTHFRTLRCNLNSVHLMTTISTVIQTIVPLGSRCTFYSPNGALNTSVLEKIISTKRDQVGVISIDYLAALKLILVQIDIFRVVQVQKECAIMAYHA